MTDATPKWARLPLKWIHEQGLSVFQGGKQLGVSMAALKILMAVLLRAENKAPASAEVTQGSACLSYDELMEMTGLSRSMIAAGTKRLGLLGLVTVTREGRGGKNRYAVADYMVGAWGRIPYRSVVGPGPRYEKRVKLLHDLSCKRATDLNALKLYFLLCAHRSGASLYAMIGYEKIHEATGILKPRIRQAISLLIEFNLVRIEHEKLPAGTNTPNRYYISGL